MPAPELTNKLLILLGDGGEPETFAHPCGANARSVKFTNNTGEEALLDCDDPLGAPTAIARWVESQDSSLNISGKVAVQSFPAWRGWFDADGPAAIKNIRVEVLNSASLGGGFYTIPCVVQEVEITTEGKGNISFTATIMGAGPRVWTPAT